MLKANEDANQKARVLCTNCHNGTGSQLDVMDGIKLAAQVGVRPEWKWDTINNTWQSPSGTAVTVAAPYTLLGGGFQYVGDNGTIASAVTSTHFDAVAGTQGVATSDDPWGYKSGVIRSTWADGDNTAGNVITGVRGAAMGSNLECISCHNPHGSTNYRMLNAEINAFAVNVKAWVSGATTANEGARGLETGASTNKYTVDYYYSGGQNLGATVTDTQANIASFCSACHTAYPSGSATTGLIAGGATNFRHRTEVALGAAWPGCGVAAGCTTAGGKNPETGASALFTGTRLRLADDGTTANNVVTCLTCHRAHGSAASMSGNALLGTGTQATVSTDSSLGSTLLSVIGRGH